MKTDIIKFEKEVVQWGNEGLTLTCAKILINSIPLIETVHAYELPYAKKYNQESIAGDYIYLYADALHKQLSGKERLQEYENETLLLICPCGCAGCWDFLVVVEESEACVVWKNLHNPQRSSSDGSREFWDYSGFPTFCFDKKQYQEEIRKLATLK